MSRERRLGRIGIVLLLAVAAAGVRGDEPLTTADLVRFLRAGISEGTILSELHSRGFSEALDAPREASLREAGATETLVVAVRRAAPAGAPVTPAAATASRPRGGAAPPVEGPRGLTFSASARSVRVPVSVLDKRGQPVLGLSEENFHIMEDGRQQPVTFFSGERRPLRIVLALDISTSMSDKMREVSEALQHFIDILEPADEIMVMTFSGVMHVEQNFTSDRDALERVFSRLQPDQGTALFDVTIEAIQRVASGPAESKAVVLVTDGMDTASRATFEELREVARRSEVPVFSIGIGTEGFLRNLLRPGGVIGTGSGGRGPLGGFPGRGGRGGRPGGGGGGRGWPGGGGGRGGPLGVTESDLDARTLRALAEDTGGRAEILKGVDTNFGKVDRLKEAVESIAVTLRHRYLVGYEPQAQASKPGWRKIKVEVDRPSVTVQARKGYYTES
jgi:VWFA-related protein